LSKATAIQIAQDADQANVALYFPRILISAGEALNQARVLNEEVDWRRISIEDDRIYTNGWYIKPLHPTPEPGKFVL
jgi:hypothetical protein